MPKAGELKQDRPKIAFVGGSGAGKTSLALTLGPGLTLHDFDGNVRTGLFCGDGMDEQRAEANVEQFIEPDPMKDAIGFENSQKLLEQYKKKGVPEGCVAVAVDSLTSLAESAMMMVQKANGNLGKQPTQPEWGSANRAVSQYINLLHSLPVASIIIAHDDIVEKNGEFEFRLGVPGQQLKKDLPKKFTDIWYVDSKVVSGKQSFTVYTGPKGAIKAKSSGPLERQVDAADGLEPMFKTMGYL